jgi:hypothetical protein
MLGFVWFSVPNCHGLPVDLGHPAVTHEESDHANV